MPAIDTTEVDSGRANTIPARFNSVRNTYDGMNAEGRSKGWAQRLSKALRILHPTPNNDSELLSVANNEHATRKRANSQFILRYYVDR